MMFTSDLNHSLYTSLLKSTKQKNIGYVIVVICQSNLKVYKSFQGSKSTLKTQDEFIFGGFSYFVNFEDVLQRVSLSYFLLILKLDALL